MIFCWRSLPIFGNLYKIKKNQKNYKYLLIIYINILYSFDFFFTANHWESDTRRFRLTNLTIRVIWRKASFNFLDKSVYIDTFIYTNLLKPSGVKYTIPFLTISNPHLNDSKSAFFLSLHMYEELQRIFIKMRYTNII